MRHYQHRPPRAVTVCLVLALLFSILFSVLSLAGTGNFIKGAIVTVSSPFTTLFDRVGEGIYNVLYGNRQRYARWEEQKRLYELQIADQQKQLATLQELKNENEQLRAYLGLSDTRQELILTEAALIYTADTTGSLVVLNKGSRDGIQVGMPVLDSYGLYGTVCELSRTTCKVATVLDEQAFIGVTNARSGVGGTLCGDEESTGLCLLRYLDANTDIATQLLQDDMIVTSGHGDKYPAGLLVGRIVHAGADPNSRAPYAYVDVRAEERFGVTSGYLMIVKGEREQPIEDGQQEDTAPEASDPEQGQDGELPAEGEQEGTVSEP